MLTERDIERIVSQYDAEVRANDAHFDALRSVAKDADGEVMWELIATAERMGYILEDSPSGLSDADVLQDAADDYQRRLRLELGHDGHDGRRGHDADEYGGGQR